MPQSDISVCEVNPLKPVLKVIIKISKVETCPFETCLKDDGWSFLRVFNRILCNLVIYSPEGSKKNINDLKV